MSDPNNPAGATDVQTTLLRFLEDKTKATLAPDQDLFASGLVPSVFAMELVVFLEERFAVEIAGSDLRMDNFRSVQRMAGLVERLRDG